MKIDEFVKKVNQNDRMKAEKVDSVIAICDDSEHEVLDIPCTATNLLDIGYVNKVFLGCFGKPSREYLSALIEEFLHTPVEERFPEKKYCLRWFDDYDNEKNYLCDPDCWSLTNDPTVDIGERAIFTEHQLEKLKKGNPRLAPAIDVMKEPAEGNKI